MFVLYGIYNSNYSCSVQNTQSFWLTEVVFVEGLLYKQTVYLRPSLYNYKLLSFLGGSTVFIIIIIMFNLNIKKHLFVAVIIT